MAALWHGLRWLSVAFGPIWLVGKIACTVFAYIWVRATLPRLRYDQLMNLGWKSLLPLAVLNLIVVAIWVVAVEMYGPLIGMAIAFGVLFVGLVIYLNIVSVGRRKSDPLASRSITMVNVKAEVHLVVETTEPKPAGAG